MMQQLSAQDAQFLYIQTANNLTHVMGVNIYDPSTAPGGKVRFKDIIAHMESRLHTSPVFKRKLYRLPFDIDHPYWVEDEHFDLEAHISHCRLPEPADWRQFCIQTARLHSKPMDMNRPLWDMTVIEGLDRIAGFSKGSYAIATRLHHATIDGASAAHVFVAMSDKNVKGTPAVEMPDINWDLGDVPTPADIMSRAVNSNISSPVKLANAFLKLAPALMSAAQKNMSGDEKSGATEIPDTRFNAAVSPHKMFDAITFPLSDFKDIRKKVAGATINDVVLATCGGALRKYLTKHKELSKNSLIGWVPINARSRSGEDQTPGNNISAMTVKIGSNIADPMKRLEAVCDVTRKSKAAKSGLSARLMTDLSQHIPGATMAGVARIMTSERFAPKMSNLFISNIPGPQQTLYMNGAKLTHQYALAPLSNGMGLFIVTPSYNGKMSFNIISDRKIMPDIVFFRECIQKAFEELRDSKPKTLKSKAGRKARVTKKAPKKSAKTRPKGKTVGTLGKRKAKAANTKKRSGKTKRAPAKKAVANRRARK